MGGTPLLTPRAPLNKPSYRRDPDAVRPWRDALHEGIDSELAGRVESW